VIAKISFSASSIGLNLALLIVALVESLLQARISRRNYFSRTISINNWRLPLSGQSRKGVEVFWSADLNKLISIYQACFSPRRIRSAYSYH
jgi:hypothetical protein